MCIHNQIRLEELLSRAVALRLSCLMTASSCEAGIGLVVTQEELE